jgi:hypothetical protein
VGWRRGGEAANGRRARSGVGGSHFPANVYAAFLKFASEKFISSSAPEAAAAADAMATRSCAPVLDNAIRFSLHDNFFNQPSWSNNGGTVTGTFICS